ncbi:hypothetical protein [Amycolatopsis sp. NPDC003731]
MTGWPAYFWVLPAGWVLLGPVLAWSKRLGEDRADPMAARLLAGHPAQVDRIKKLQDRGFRA